MLCCVISPPKRVRFFPRLVMALAIVVGLLFSTFSAAAQKDDVTQQVVNALTGAQLSALSGRVQTLELSNPAAVANELTHVKADLKDLQDSVGEQRKWLYGIFAAVIGHMLMTGPAIRIGRKDPLPSKSEATE